MNYKKEPQVHEWMYTKNIFKIILLASMVISVAVIVTGVVGYVSTKNSLIHKAKSQDIVFIVKSMALKVDERIKRAIETSSIFAKDSVNREWIQGEEKDEELGKTILNRIENIAYSYDYSNFFLASAKTEKYYFRERSTPYKGALDGVVLSKKNLADGWFYETLAGKKRLWLNVNYDRAMDDYFLFVNTLMEEENEPLGVCGVGLSLKDITEEFRTFKVGEQSSLWVIDEKGIIQLSDEKEDIGKTYREFVPKDILTDTSEEILEVEKNLKVSQYRDNNKQIVDYAYYTLDAHNWILFYKIPRNESISLISTVRLHMIITVSLILCCFILLFYMITKKIADPYKQALLINGELEEQVNIRTQELIASNQKIVDSIEYAKRLQESILPSQKDLKGVFKDYFIIWKPRDIVGGDFFWLREIEDTIIFAVGDCTGHGVPGALMTMTVNAIFHHIVLCFNRENPSIILKELHRRLREVLNKNQFTQEIDDGADIAVFCIKNKETLLYAGANIELYVKNDREVNVFKPQTKGIGYNYIEMKEEVDSEIIKIEEGDVFMVTTDGFIHQNGGHKNYPFGKKRLYNMIQTSETSDLSLLKNRFEQELKEYMGSEDQRDDMAMVAFKIK